MKIHRFLIDLAALILLSSAARAFDPAQTVLETVPGDGYRSAVTLSDGLTYIKTVDAFGSYAEREHILHYTPNGETKLSFVTGQYLHKTDTIRGMAAYAFPKDNFVGGINADFFNMSTGVPESALIIDGELYSTDRTGNCLARKSDGSYFIGKPSVHITLRDHADNTVFDIAHLNKEFSSLGLYLYDSRYAVYTNVFVSNTTVTLRAYDDMLDLDTMYDTFRSDEIDELRDACLAASEEEQEACFDLFRSALEAASGYHYLGGCFYHLTSTRPAVGQTVDLVSTAARTSSESLPIVSDGYMLCYAAPSYSYLDSRFTAGHTFTMTVGADEQFIGVTDAIGTGAVIVKDGEPIDDRSLSHYTTLQPRSAVGIRPDGSLVFYGVDGRQSGYSSGYKIYDMAKRLIALGCVDAANFDGGGSTAVNASLPGYDTVSTVNKPSDKSERKVSNAVVFTNTDTKTGNAVGAYIYPDYLTTFDDYPILLPDAVLSDENGYAASGNTYTLYTHEEDGSIDGRVFMPNGKDGLLPICASVGNNTNIAGYVLTVGEPEKITLKTDKTDIKLYDTAKIDVSSTMRLMTVSGDATSYTWTNNGEEGIVSEDKSGITISWTDAVIRGGILTPLTDGQSLHIRASRGGKSSEISIRVDDLPFADIKDHWGLTYIDKLYDAGVVIGEPGEDGQMYFNPARTYSRAEFCVMVSRIVDLEEFAAAREAAEEAAKAEAETAEEETATAEAEDAAEEEQPDIEDASNPPDIPDNTDEEAGPVDPEECEEETAPELPFADEVKDWAKDAVTNMYRAGFLDDIAHYDEDENLIFDGAAPITRMEVIRVLGQLCEDAPEDYTVSFPDVPESEAASRALRAAAYRGLFTGYEDGTLRPDNFLTRAEGATVFTRLIGIR